MYTLSYKNVIEEDFKAARKNESIAFDKVIELLENGKIAGLQSSETELALDRVRDLWKFFVDDLVNPDNQLPNNTKGTLISIGLWVMREVDKIRYKESEDIDSIIAVNRLIRDGLV